MSTSEVPKKPFSYSISIVDKIDTLVGFFVINEKPTSSKDPFALRRSAIGLLRIIIENKLSLKLREIISYAIRLYEEQGVQIQNEKTEQEVLHFIKERMRNILKLKNLKPSYHLAIFWRLGVRLMQEVSHKQIFSHQPFYFLCLLLLH